MKHTVKTKDYGTTKKVVDIDNYARARAIKAFCTECLGFEENPRDCTAKTCPLYPFRGRTTVAMVEGRPIKNGETELEDWD